MKILNLLLLVTMSFTTVGCGLGLLGSDTDRNSDYDDYYDDDWAERENRRIEEKREQDSISNKVQCEDEKTCPSFSGLLHRQEAGRLGTCSVVLIAPNKIATNAHCLKTESNGYEPHMRNHVVYFPKNRSFPGETARFKRILGRSRHFLSDQDFSLLPDIAIAELDRSLKRDFIEIDHVSGIEPGETYTIHKTNPPTGRNKPAMVKTEQCDAKSETFLMPEYTGSDDPVAFMKDCHVIGGNSGSAVLNRQGRLVGLIHAGKNFNFDPKKTRLRLPGLRDLMGSLIRGEDIRFVEKVPQYELAYYEAFETVAPFGHVSSFRCVDPSGRIKQESQCMTATRVEETLKFSDYILYPGFFDPIWEWGRENSSQFLWTFIEMEQGRYAVRPACMIRARESGRDYPGMGEVTEYYDSVEWNFSFYVDENVKLVPYLKERVIPTRLNAYFGALDLKLFGFNGVKVDLAYYRRGEDLDVEGEIVHEMKISLCDRGLDREAFYDLVESELENFIAEERASRTD